MKIEAKPLPQLLYDTPFGKNRNEIMYNLLDVYNLPATKENLELVLKNPEDVCDLIDAHGLSPKVLGDWITLHKLIKPKVALFFDKHLIKRDFYLV